jgi:hypothetical protein
MNSKITEIGNRRIPSPKSGSSINEGKNILRCLKKPANRHPYL